MRKTGYEKERTGYKKERTGYKKEKTGYKKERTGFTFLLYCPSGPRLNSRECRNCFTMSRSPVMSALCTCLTSSRNHV